MFPSRIVAFGPVLPMTTPRAPESPPFIRQYESGDPGDGWAPWTTPSRMSEPSSALTAARVASPPIECVTRMARSHSRSSS